MHTHIVSTSHLHPIASCELHYYACNKHNVVNYLSRQAGVDAGGGALQPDRGTLDGILFDERDAPQSMGASPATPRANPLRRTPVTGSSIDRSQRPAVDHADGSASEAQDVSLRDAGALMRASHTSLERLFDQPPVQGDDAVPMWTWLLQVWRHATLTGHCM